MAGEYIIPAKKINRAFQLSVELTSEHDIKNTVHFCALTVYKWIKTKFKNVYKLEPKIPCDFNKRDLNILYAEGEHFCCRMEHADGKFLGREWITEVELVRRDEKILLGVKVTYTTPENADYDRNIFSVPTFVWRLLSKNTFKDVRELKTSVLEANTPERLDELYDLLTDERRLLPVIVVTDPVDDFDGEPKPLIDPKIFFARRPDGDKSHRYEVGLVAHVAHIPAEMCLRWKELVGEGWDVYNGAVRTYYENLNFDATDFYNHPLRTAKSIAAFEYVDQQDRELFGVEAFVEFLSDKLVNNDTKLRIDWRERGHKFFYAAKVDRLNDTLKNQGDQIEAEWTALYREEIDTLEKDKADYVEIIAGCEEDIANLKEQLAAEKQKVFALTAYRDELLAKLNESGKIVDIIPAEDDCKLEDIPQWVDKYFPDKIVLLPKVLKSLADMDYDNPRLVYEALQLLGTEYWQMRTGASPDAKAKFDAKREELHLEKGFATTKESAGMMGDEYKPVYKGKKISPRELRHLTHGVSRKTKYCLRIYFFWDDEDNGQVVITWLLNHLDTPDT